MTENRDNPLDDELLKELGLEPKEPPSAKSPQGGTASPPPSGILKDRATLATSPPPVAKPPPSKPPPPRMPAAPAGAPPAARGGPPPRKPTVPETRPAAQPASSPPFPPSQAGEQFQQSLGHLSEDMPVQVVAVLGKRTMTLKDVIGLKQGEVIELKKLPQETIDLVANGKLMARGELVLVDGKLGIQIKQLVG